MLLHLAYALECLALQFDAVIIVKHAHSFIHTKTLRNNKLDTMIIVAAYKIVKL